jgi:hypothetical protein
MVLPPQTQGVEESQPPLATYAVPPPRERGEMLYVFRQEIEDLRVTVERWTNPPSGEFLNAAFALFGIAGGAAVALISHYSQKTPRSASEATLLWVIGVAGLIAAVACTLAARALAKTQQSTRDALLDDLRRLQYESPVAKSAAEIPAEQQEEVEP